MVAMLGCQEAQSPEVWRDCDEALAALEPPAAVPTESIVPLKVGRSMPVLSISAPPPDAEVLANRALATACVLAEGEVFATAQMLEWAERAAADDTNFEESAAFDDAELWVSSASSPTIATRVEVERRTRVDHTGDGLEYDSLRAVAEDVVMELIEVGVIPNVETPTLRSWTDRGGSAWTFGFTSQVAGVPVLGRWVYVTIDRNGGRRSIEIHDVGIEVVGDVAAAVDEPTAEKRFLELAQSAHPESVIFFEDVGRVAYLVPVEEGAVAVEPVWTATWNAGNREDWEPIGARRSSLSLSDPDGELLPYGP